jgi:hypothetical protein
VALSDLVPLVLECKGCRLDDIKSIQGAVWLMAEPWQRAQEDPSNQARTQAIALGKMLPGAWAPTPMAHTLVDLAFIARKDWVVQFGAFGYTSAILFAGDISSSERLASRILDIARKSRAGYIQ